MQYSWGLVQSTVLAIAVLGAGCGGSAGGTPSDAGIDPVPDGSMPGDGNDGGMIPPGDPNPFPSEPAGGEFAWVVSAAGAREPVSVAVDRAGSILVVATQIGAVTMGGVQLPAPTGQALLVLKLTSDGKPIWGRSFAGASSITGRAITATPEGDVVVGGEFKGGRLVVGSQGMTSAGGSDGFLIVLDGATGAPRWSASATSPGDDDVAGLAVGPDAAGVDAIYVYGQVGAGASIAGRAFAAGAYLIRYDAGGALRWANSFASVDPGFAGTLAVDPARGPVIAGRFGGTLAIGDQVLTGGSMVAGFDPDGQVRFARAIASRFTALDRALAVAPAGDVYLTSGTEGTPTVVDGHIIANPSSNNDLFLLRLTPEGQYAFAQVIAGRQFVSPRDVAVDASGAAYMLGTCNGTLAVEPEITCDIPGGIITSYGVDNTYRWSTSLGPALVESIAAAPGERLIVAGEASFASVTFGGVHVPTQRLFIAALATGPARLPSPLPAPPVISRVTLAGAFDDQIREGGRVTLVIDGAALDHVTSARLGDIDVHVPPNAGTANQLLLPVQIPHGHAPGFLSLALGNAGGTAQADDVVTVTPIVVAQTAPANGVGTFSSPMPLCSVNASGILAYGDVVVVLDGVYGCGAFVPRGVTLRGQSTAGTIVHGTLSVEGDGIGAAGIENLTIESTGTAAIDMSFGGQLGVADLVVQSSSGSGILVDGGGSARVSHYRYLNSGGAALVIGQTGTGQVEARDVTADQALRGVVLGNGTLDLAGSDLSSDEAAIDAGDASTSGGTREVAIADTTLRSTRVGITAAGARVTVTGCTLERGPGAPGRLSDGIQLFGGSLALTRSVLRGWDLGGITVPLARSAVDAALDGVEIDAGDTGVAYASMSGLGGFRLRNSVVAGRQHGLVLGDGFEAVDLGTAASPGGNQLENASGGFALEDVRGGVGGTVDARGTTLNGMSFAGDVLGPASAAGAYSVSARNTIRF